MTSRWIGLGFGSSAIALCLATACGSDDGSDETAGEGTASSTGDASTAATGSPTSGGTAMSTSGTSTSSSDTGDATAAASTGATTAATGTSGSEGTDSTSAGSSTGDAMLDRYACDGYFFAACSFCLQLQCETTLEVCIGVEGCCCVANCMAGGLDGQLCAIECGLEGVVPSEAEDLLQCKQVECDPRGECG